MINQLLYLARLRSECSEFELWKISHQFMIDSHSFGVFMFSAAGNSPPVRDRPPDKSKQRRAENIRRNLTSHLGKTHRVKGRCTKLYSI